MKTLNPAPNFKLIGHRGVAGLRPENTYESFAFAAELGLNWIEFDVQLSKDEKWIVIHDDTVDRTTTGRGLVTNFTAKDLEKLKVPTLQGTLEFALQHGLQCNIEIKGANIDPLKYSDLMIDFINSNQTLFRENPVFSSFDLPCLIELRKLLPNLEISYLIDAYNIDTIAIAKKYNFTSINCDVKNITEQDVKLTLHENIPVLLFTINDRANAKYWFDKGVSAIFTDRPDLLIS